MVRRLNLTVSFNDLHRTCTDKVTSKLQKPSTKESLVRSYECFPAVRRVQPSWPRLPDLSFSIHRLCYILLSFILLYLSLCCWKKFPPWWSIKCYFILSYLGIYCMLCSNTTLRVSNYSKQGMDKPKNAAQGEFLKKHTGTGSYIESR